MHAFIYYGCMKSRALNLKTPKNVDELKALYKDNELVYYTPMEEFINTLTHGAGAVFAAIFMIFMLLKSSTPAAYVTSVLTGLCLCAEFAISAAYHGVSDIKKKRVMRRIDFPAVNLNVIACGTGLCLLYRNLYGYIAFGLSFVIGIAMLFLCLHDFRRFHNVSVISNFVIGGLLFAAFFVAYFSPIGMPPVAVYLYLAGLIACLIGAILFGIHIRYAHCVFHVFVLAGPILIVLSTYFQLT